ncbi:LysR family transcriptional regulator, partial [Xylella fastidiosa subsp. multiplex]|nr:LysR family transcriptional regulator [Xylella fastidiosa subsp. multiplex]
MTDRSVSRAAIRLGMYQPAVSAALKRLRELLGDPLLVRLGSGMVPTDAGLRMIEPVASILRAAAMRKVVLADCGSKPRASENSISA